MTLKVYKLVKMVTQLLGVAGGIYAMQQGAQPLAIFFMMTVIIAGPESLEYLIEQGDAP